MRHPWASFLLGVWYAGRTMAAYQVRRLLTSLGYVTWIYRWKSGRFPDYRHPRRFSEKLGWMRLHDRNPLYTQLADKIAVRDYVRARVGEQVLIPCYGTWRKPAEIPFDSLPTSFVLKCNHECGFVILCRDRDRLDRRLVRMQLSTRLRMNYYYHCREWPYLNIPPRIMAEEYLRDEHGHDAMDYKFHCFDGVPGYVYVVKDRHRNPVCACYSPDWQRLPFTTPDYGADGSFPRPPLLGRMLGIATRLSKGLYYCRVDLYAVRGRVYFGEMTLVSGAGLLRYAPDHYDFHLGKLLRLPGEQSLKSGMKSGTGSLSAS